MGIQPSPPSLSSISGLPSRYAGAADRIVDRVESGLYRALDVVSGWVQRLGTLHATLDVRDRIARVRTMREFEEVLGWDANYSGDGCGTVPSLPLELQGAALVVLAERIPHLPPSQRLRGIHLFAAAAATLGRHGGRVLAERLEALELAQEATRQASHVVTWAQYQAVSAELADVPPVLQAWPLVELGYRIALLPIQHQAEAIGAFRVASTRLRRHATPDLEPLADALSMPPDFRALCVAVAAANAGADVQAVARTYGVGVGILESNLVCGGRAAMEAASGENLQEVARTYGLTAEGLRRLESRRPSGA